MPCQGTRERVTMRSLSSASLGRGRLPAADGAACPLHTLRDAPDAPKLGASQGKARNEARAQLCLPI